ncbi:AmiS/UreI family transporter [Comamonas composti]|uniref:AmiS/UreI family transporter n=1 Tax=Comamonas composti TaxID=408558 RepID=UPI000407F1B1|nr:AmiS/UreI family transporter [Comamonas composti]
MLGLALFFIGVVLMVNGVGLMGHIDRRESAILNLLVGLLALLISVIGIWWAREAADFSAVAGGLLFAFTYLYLAAVQWWGLKGTGLGWYCLFVAVSALIFAAAAADIRLIAMWLLWTSLWFLFFLTLALNKSPRFLPLYTIFVGIVSCWIPGTLMLLGKW